MANRNYRNIDEVTEEYLRNHPEEQAAWNAEVEAEKSLPHFYIEFPPLSGDRCRVLTEKEWGEGNLPTNHNYEHVTVGENGDFRTVEELYQRWNGVKKA